MQKCMCLITRHGQPKSGKEISDTSSALKTRKWTALVGEAVSLGLAVNIPHFEP